MIDRIFGWGMLVSLACTVIIVLITNNFFVSVVGGLVCGVIWDRLAGKDSDGSKP